MTISQINSSAENILIRCGYIEKNKITRKIDKKIIQKLTGLDELNTIQDYVIKKIETDDKIKYFTEKLELLRLIPVLGKIFASVFAFCAFGVKGLRFSNGSIPIRELANPKTVKFLNKVDKIKSELHSIERILPKDAIIKIKTINELENKLEKLYSDLKEIDNKRLKKSETEENTYEYVELEESDIKKRDEKEQEIQSIENKLKNENKLILGMLPQPEQLRMIVNYKKLLNFYKESI